MESFNQDKHQLVNGGSVILPVYNFKKGEREYSNKYLSLGDKDIVIVKGIHALNEKISMAIRYYYKYRIFIVH